MIKLKLDREQVKMLCAMLNAEKNIYYSNENVKKGHFYSTLHYVLALDLGYKLTIKYLLKIKTKFSISLIPSEACCIMLQINTLETYIQRDDYDTLHFINVVRTSLDQQLKNQNFNYYGN